jgi:hypothetical protein
VVVASQPAAWNERKRRIESQWEVYSSPLTEDSNGEIPYY